MNVPRKGATLRLKLVVDLLSEVERSLASGHLADLTTAGDTNSLSGTATKMRSLMAANREVKQIRDKVAEVVQRCELIAREEPGMRLEDGTTAAEIHSRALLARANMVLTITPAMNVFKRRRSYEEAMSDLKRSIVVCPNQETYISLGVCALQLKEPETAIDAYRACIELDSESEKALEAARQLRSLGRM